MRCHTRPGMAILYCIGLSAIIVMIGFGFLRATSRDTAGGSAAQHVLLAQSAARAGLAEATEAILADYASTSLEVGSDATLSKIIANPPTFLDGPYRAPFVSKTNSDRLKGIDTNSTTGMNDVRAENAIIQPMTRMLDHDNMGQTLALYTWHTNNIMMYDGRGRYIEPNYHNTARPSPAGSSPTPVSPTLFLDSTALPNRHNGLFLDSSMRRIASDGSPGQDLAARKSARYRLRYALGVVDLGGQLLSNPKPDLNFDWKDPNNEYRKPPLWIQEAGEAWYNMAAAFPTYINRPNNNVTHPLRWQNVFLGRGNASNFDRQATGGFPVTFPMMFRINLTTIPTGSTSYWGLYASKLGPWSGGTNGSETTGLLQMPGVTASAGGGELLKVSNIWDIHLSHQLGPQPSWFTQYQSVRGSLGEGSDRYDAGEYVREQAPVTETAMFLPTPFGRGISIYNPTSGGTRKWYEGHVNSPWHVNLLTAPPKVINCMLNAYLPPRFKKLPLSLENFALNATPTTLMLGTWNTINIARTTRTHDLFTTLAGPAFSEWPAPSSGVTPNFLAPDTRTAEQTYPGPLWNDPDCDDMGRLIDVDDRTNALNGFVTYPCTHSSGSFYGSIGFSTGYKSNGTPASTPPTGWGSNGGDRFYQRTAPSYWYDITYAFTSAVSFARAVWVQYPNSSVSNPATLFNPTSLRDPELYDSIKDFDRLFLRQLGEDFTNPGSAPLAPIAYSSSKFTTVSVAAISNNLKTLRAGNTLDKGAYATADRVKVMERVLNDFRMSFLGASPQYYDDFRPLDFDGDGKVMCSCYNSSNDATEKSLGTDRWKSVDGSFTDADIPGATGRGPAPDNWFSLAGAFYIGKSHHYRIICRGELFDNVLQRPVSDATLESVLVVDPEGNDITQSHYLFQRWHHGRYTGHLSLIER